MSNHDDEKAFTVLENAVHKAQHSLEQTQHFSPFLMLLNDAGEIEVYENEEQDTHKSYALLEKMLKERIAKGDVDVMVLAVDTEIPKNFMKDVPTSIRLHLEEQSQAGKKIAARFLYVPYELYKLTETQISVRLHAPIPVGFPAEYLVKE